MKLDKRLNLIIPVERPDGSSIYVHSTPISRAVFERYFLLISKTFTAIYTQGLGITAGPRVAAMLLKRLAVEAGEWDGPEGVEAGLMAEIRRLTNVVAPGSNGWQTIPYQEAVDQKHLDEGDASEVENALVFFTVASSMHRKAELTGILEGISKLWGAQTDSLNSTEFANSLQTLTATDNSGATATPSLIPS